MTALTGTLPLVRLALRRDRLQLSIWVLAVAGLLTAVAAFFSGLLTEGPDLFVATQTFAANPVLRLFGLASGATIGAFVMLRQYALLAILAGLMSTLAVVRHTRGNEDTRRAEMVGAAAVGRHASLAAALIVAALANGALALLAALGLIANGLPAASSFAAGASLGAVGVAFAGIAAIAAQVSANSRGANGLAAAAIGVAFLLSGAGNMLGGIGEGGVRVISAWPSWLSPIGWGQQVRPFGGDHWWILGLFAAFFALTVAVAFFLENRRDVGRGMLPERRGPANAAPGLLSPIGLAWRLQRGSFLGWAAGFVMFGLVFGAISNEIEGLLDEFEAGQDLIGRLGGTAVILDAYFAAIMGMMGLVVSVYTVLTLLRLRGEEGAGPLEALLATAVSRSRWVASHVVNAALGTLALLLLAGVSTGVATGIALGDPVEWLSRLTVAAVVQAPAAFVLGGAAIAAFGLLGRRAGAFSWGAFAIAFALGPLIGALIDLPQALLNASPFTHTPLAPAVAVTAAPVLALLAVAFVLGAAGMAAFNRRDLAFQ